MDSNIKKNEVVKNYRDLNVYQLAFNSAMRIFELSKKWSKEERYSLTDQIRRTSRSVCENIAEAWRKRRYSAHFVSTLSDSDAESAETEVWLDFAFHCAYLEQQDHTELRDDYDHICRMLTNMMRYPESWYKSWRVGREAPRPTYHVSYDIVDNKQRTRLAKNYSTLVNGCSTASLNAT